MLIRWGRALIIHFFYLFHLSWTIMRGPSLKFGAQFALSLSLSLARYLPQVPSRGLSLYYAKVRCTNNLALFSLSLKYHHESYIFVIYRAGGAQCGHELAVATTYELQQRITRKRNHGWNFKRSSP